MQKDTSVVEEKYFDLAYGSEIEFSLPEGKSNKLVIMLDKFYANCGPETPIHGGILIHCLGVDGKKNSKGESSAVLSVVEESMIPGIFIYNPANTCTAQLHPKANSLTLGWTTLEGEPIAPLKDSPFIICFTLYRESNL